MRTVSFPNLGIEDIELERFLNIFGLDIAWYAIIITIGFLIAAVYALKNMKRYGLDSESGIDVIIVGLVSAIIGARVYYVAFSWQETYQYDWMSIFSIREGGLAIYGGIIGALIGGAIVCRIKRINIFAMFDVVSVGFLIGQSVGRWGNFVNIEAYGSATDSTYLFGMTSSLFEGMVHPCFLYESIWCAIGAFVIHFLSKKRVFDGQVFLMYCIWYGLERMVVEGFRVDSLFWGPFRVSQILSALLVIVATVIMISVLSKIKRNNDPEYLPLYVTTEKSKKILELAQMRDDKPAEYKEYIKNKKAEDKIEKTNKKADRKANKLQKKADKLHGKSDKKALKINSDKENVKDREYASVDTVIDTTEESKSTINNDLDKEVAETVEEIEIPDVLENQNLEKIDEAPTVKYSIDDAQEDDDNDDDEDL